MAREGNREQKERLERMEGPDPKDTAGRAANRDGVTHSSRETLEGREGFKGERNFARRDEFSGRENVTEERQDRAIPQEEQDELSSG